MNFLHNIEAIVNDVKSVLQISDANYYEWQIELAYPYLDRITDHNTTFINELTKSAIFWKWYTNQYYMVDIEFLNRVPRGWRFSWDDLRDLANYYKIMHVEMPTVPDRTVVQPISKKQRVVSKQNK